MYKYVHLGLQVCVCVYFMYVEKDLEEYSPNY